MEQLRKQHHTLLVQRPRGGQPKELTDRINATATQISDVRIKIYNIKAANAPPAPLPANSPPALAAAAAAEGGLHAPPLFPSSTCILDVSLDLSLVVLESVEGCLDLTLRDELVVHERDARPEAVGEIILLQKAPALAQVLNAFLHGRIIEAVCLARYRGWGSRSQT